MRTLPWYLRHSPTLFVAVAAIKFLEAVFTAIGANIWATEHAHSQDVGLLTSMLDLRILEAAISAFAWVGSAIIASLLLKVYDKVGGAAMMEAAE